MSRRLVITAVTVGKRTVSEVARTCGAARSWIYALLERYRAEGEAAFVPPDLPGQQATGRAPPPSAYVAAGLRRV
jgi:transposase